MLKGLKNFIKRRAKRSAVATRSKLRQKLAGDFPTDRFYDPALPKKKFFTKTKAAAAGTGAGGYVVGGAGDKVKEAQDEDRKDRAAPINKKTIARVRSAERRGILPPTAGGSGLKPGVPTNPRTGKPYKPGSKAHKDAMKRGIPTSRALLEGKGANNVGTNSILDKLEDDAKTQGKDKSKADAIYEKAEVERNLPGFGEGKNAKGARTKKADREIAKANRTDSKRLAEQEAALEGRGKRRLPSQGAATKKDKKIIRRNTLKDLEQMSDDDFDAAWPGAKGQRQTIVDAHKKGEGQKLPQTSREAWIGHNTKSFESRKKHVESTTDRNRRNKKLPDGSTFGTIRDTLVRGGMTPLDATKEARKRYDHMTEVQAERNANKIKEGARYKPAYIKPFAETKGAIQRREDKPQEGTVRTQMAGSKPGKLPFDPQGKTRNYKKILNDAGEVKTAKSRTKGTANEEKHLDQTRAAVGAQRKMMGNLKAARKKVFTKAEKAGERNTREMQAELKRRTKEREKAKKARVRKKGKKIDKEGYDYNDLDDDREMSQAELNKLGLTIRARLAKMKTEGKTPEKKDYNQTLSARHKLVELAEKDGRNRVLVGTAAGAAIGAEHGRRFLRDVKARHKMYAHRAEEGIKHVDWKKGKVPLYGSRRPMGFWRATKGRALGRTALLAGAGGLTGYAYHKGKKRYEKRKKA